MIPTIPYAKINIGLYVTERRADGYHNLQTVFYPIPLHDNLEVKPLRIGAPTQRYALQIAGNEVQGSLDDNLVVKVYNQLCNDFELPPIDIYLYKRIPTGAGLGGGSSDAAAMMKLLNEQFQLGLSYEEMEQRVSKLGADCAFFIQSRPAYAEGIGDILSPISLSLKNKFLLLVKPDIFVSTREAYAGVTPQYPANDLRKALQQPIEEWKNTVFNDFEKSVFLAHPEIAAIKQTLYDMGAIYASMSGSGSTVFGLFNHPVEAATEVFNNCFVFQEKLLL